jgi:hypothetical protein
MPASSLTAAETDSPRMEIVGLGIVMIALSVVLLVWAFPSLPRR